MAVLMDGIRERVVRIGDTHPLVGILTEPAVDGPPERPAFLLLNAGILHRVGPSRIGVILARALAADGHPALRFDFSGIGDSGHRPDGKPFAERSVQEVGEAMDHLEALLGVRRFVALGLCSGADAAYAAALADPRVIGLVALDGHSYRTWKYWIHRYAPRLFRARSWLNLITGRTYLGPMLRRLRSRGKGKTRQVQEVDVFRRDLPPREEVAEGYRALANRGVRTLQIFTGGIEGRYNHRDQFRDAFRSVDFRGTLQLEFLADSDHTFTASSSRRALVEIVRAWSAQGWPSSRAASVALG